MVHTEREDDRVEVWKDIKDYEGFYQGSNWGRVKSLERIDCIGHHRKERILKPKKDKYGYLQVNLWKNGKKKTFTVHRLVTEAFIPNPNNLPCINHKDECKTNNNVNNLEWCDNKYNNAYGTRTERCCKPVLQYDLEGNFIREWKSTAECGRNGFKQGAVAACCRGELKKYKDFIWKYK